METNTASERYEGALAHRDLPDGRVLVLYEMIYNWRLCIGPQGDEGYERGWCYPKERVVDALLALHEWDGAGTPPGEWIKEVGT